MQANTEPQGSVLTSVIKQNQRWKSTTKHMLLNIKQTIKQTIIIYMFRFSIEKTSISGGTVRESLEGNLLRKKFTNFKRLIRVKKEMFAVILY